MRRYRYPIKSHFFVPRARGKEQFLQEQLVIWLNSLKVLYCASAGGMRTNIRTAIKMKRAGYKKGFPDIFIYEPRGPYHGLAIEIKVSSYPTPEQTRWKADLLHRGYKAEIMPTNLNLVEAIDWFKKEVSNYLELERKR